MIKLSADIVKEDKAKLDKKLENVEKKLPDVNRVALQLVAAEVISTSVTKYLSGQVLHRRTGQSRR